MGWQQDSEMVSKGGDQGQCVQPADIEMQISSIHPVFSCQGAVQLKEIHNLCGPPACSFLRKCPGFVP